MRCSGKRLLLSLYILRDDSAMIIMMLLILPPLHAVGGLITIAHWSVQIRRSINCA